MGFFHQLHHEHPARYDQMFPYLWIYTGVLALAGLLMSMYSGENILHGLYLIITTEDALITDYVLVAGPGAALVNSAIVTAIAICALDVADDTLNGMTLVEMGLMSGFSLFGKNFFNIWPILAGTWLYTKLRRQPLAGNIGIGLMATALAPIVSYIGLDNGWGGPIEGMLVGMAIGFIMPPLAAYTYRIQNGMNLYNVGFACGLVAFICVPLMASMGADPTTHYRWARGYNLPFGILLGVMCAALIVIGLFFSKKPIWASWAGYRRLLQTSGRAPSDYLRMFGPAPVLINAGVNGLIGMACILLSGGDLNGPTVGGILTIMGFSAFGKHAFNIVPVMAGVALGSVVMEWSLTDSAVQLACLFCTTLAPISGYFGWLYGVLAGFLHSSVVLYTGSPVAGMNLYNNGFSGGLVAIVLYPAILAIARHRKPVLQDEDYFDQLEGDRPVMPPEPKELKEE
ncbi:DUF1576 domain-containing protein [Colidextribacter sp. OB.20]|uniref:DUF1576 domain-containing protein n=1 Tax=Colidextribacter sp. OB.20 TaxID=2304568 RepID=UPI00136BB992|nr:DUF1576 domain-containing protein [Colidextribacter sp. OB.20]NBI10980.1 DUF1576 domain-containing protein [Colidextribacter sp. OB.20]